MFNHILLEAFCTKDYDENQHKNRPDFCMGEDNIPQYSCLQNNCPFFNFTSHENALCYINENSEAEEIISLGGEMFFENMNCDLLWKEISIRKINEAYSEYMDKMKS